MKKLLSLLLALTMALSLFACSKPEEGKEEGKGDGDGLVTVYLPVSRTEYKADGTRGYQHDTYTYTDKGLLLSHTTDNGLMKETFDEEDMVFIYEPQAYDGTPNRVIEIQYNDRGHRLWYTQTDYHYDNETGELTETTQDARSKAQNCSYEYFPDGKIHLVSRHSVTIEGETGDLSSYDHHHYDEKGNLVEISAEYLDSQLGTRWAYDYRYDEQGRLTACTTRPMEGMYIRQYKYDTAGRLSSMVCLGNALYAPLDDQHVAKPTYEEPTTGHYYRGEVTFTYDAAGNLISRKCYDNNQALEREQTCEYRDGKLYKIIENDRTIVITADEGEVGNADVALIVDANGNVVKRVNSDGSYIVFEYQAFRLTEEEAKIAQSSYYCYNRVDASGQLVYNHVNYLSPGLSAQQTVTYPVTELYPYDIALKD